MHVSWMWLWGGLMMAVWLVLIVSVVSCARSEHPPIDKFSMANTPETDRVSRPEC